MFRPIRSTPPCRKHKILKAPAPAAGLLPFRRPAGRTPLVAAARQYRLPAMMPLLRLSLVLLMLLTSVALGMARGQLRNGPELVLCTGNAVVVVAPDGQPGDAGTGGHAHYCPDMATALIAALDLPPVLPRRPVGPPQGAMLAEIFVPAMADRPAPQARGPPPTALG